MARDRQRIIFLFLSHFSACIVILFASLPTNVDGYTNYTVGDSIGWYDALEKPEVDYQKWAAGKNFRLGDFLIFNTDNNHSVIQTSNFTTYNVCDYEDASSNDTIQWSSADPSSTAIYPVTVAVPLLAVGAVYFFSGDYDGEQCQNGQHFKINVTYGQGLPPTLEPPSDESIAPISPQSGDDDSAPDTLVPSNFDHPKNADDGDDETNPSNGVALIGLYKPLGACFHGLLMIGIFFSF